MKLIVVIPGFYPYSRNAGPSIYLHQLMCSLSKYLDVEVITSDKGRLQNEKYINKKKINNNYKIKYGRSVFKGFSFEMIKNIFKSFKDTEIIYYNSFFNFYLIFILFINLFFKKKIIISPRGQLMKNNILRRKTTFKFIFSYFINILNQKKITYIFSSEFEKKESKYILKSNNYNSKIIPNSLSLSNDLNNKFNIKKLNYSKKIQITTIARYSPEKNLEIIFDIAKKLPNYDFNIYGPYNKYSEKLIRKKKEMNIQNVFLNGYVNDLQKILLFKKTDIFLLTSTNENFANVILESIFFYRPVVVCKPSYWESVIKFNNVGHISKFDVKSICNNLKKVAQDYNKLKKRDFNNVIKIHQNENISKTFKAFIYELIN